MDYWICEEVELDNLLIENIYDQSDECFYYLDSNYTFIEDDEGNLELTRPHTYYKISLKENIWAVSSILIRDPNVTIYNVGISSNGFVVYSTFIDMDFMYLDRYSGMPPEYLKDEIRIRITTSYINIYTNLI